MSGYIYTNVNESKQNLFLKLISTIHNILNDNTMKDHNNKPRLIINYNFHDNKKLLSNYDNSNLIPIVFSP